MDWVMEYQPERYNVLMRRFGWVSGGEGSERKGETLGNVWYAVHVLYIVYIYIHGQDIYFNIYIYISRGKLSYYFDNIYNIYIYAIMCMSNLCMYLSMQKDWCNWVLTLVSWLIDEKNHTDHRICL